MKTHLKILVGLLSFTSITVSAQSSLQIDMSTASVTKSAAGRIVISGVGAGGSLYDAELQWDPYNLRFDFIPETVLITSGDARVCNLGTVTLAHLQRSEINVSLTTDKLARTITWKMTMVTAFNNDLYPATVLFGSAETGYRLQPTLVQNGRDVAATWNAANLNSSTALISKAPSSVDQSWNTIPIGSSREAVMNNIPTYIDLNAPLSKVFWGGNDYACL